MSTIPMSVDIVLTPRILEVKHLESAFLIIQLRKLRHREVHK